MLLSQMHMGADTANRKTSACSSSFPKEMLTPITLNEFDSHLRSFTGRVVKGAIM